MSIDISGIGPTQVPGVTPTTAAAAASPVAPPAPTPDEDAVTVDLQSLPDTPPPEVSAAIAAASDVYDHLTASGQHVAFDVDDSGSLQVQLQSEDGSAQTLSASDVLRLAGGEGLT